MEPKVTRPEPVKLTILLSSFNYSRYIVGALGRILPQLEPGFELIIIDDASTDGTLTLIEPLVMGNPAVHLIINKKNRGIHSVLNQGLALARGRLFICAAADDRIRPGLLASSVELLEHHPYAALCTAPAVQVAEGGEVIAGWSGPSLPDRAYLGPAAALSLMRRWGFWFCGSTTMFRTHLLQERSGFLVQLGNLADSFASQQLAIEYGFCSLSEPQGEVRILSESYSCAERYDLAKTNRLRLEAVNYMRSSPKLFPEDFINEWAEVWGFLDAMKAWHRKTLWAQRIFLHDELLLFRHKPRTLDHLFVKLVTCAGYIQFALFGLWGFVFLARHRLFWRYLRPIRFYTWLKKQLG